MIITEIVKVTCPICGKEGYLKTQWLKGKYLAVYVIHIRRVTIDNETFTRQKACYVPHEKAIPLLKNLGIKLKAPPGAVTEGLEDIIEK